MGALSGCRGRVRVRSLRQHRLAQFESAFDRLLVGKADAEYVHRRGAKLVEARRR